MGYTYNNPVNLAGADSTASSDNPVLKYRYVHSFKGDLDFEAKRFTFGFNWIYNSPMKNVDRLFCDERDPEQMDAVEADMYQFYFLMSDLFLLPGYWNYRIANANMPFVSFDARFGFKFNEHIRASFLMKNVFNTEYVGRPGDMRPPRRFELQLSAKF